MDVFGVYMLHAKRNLLCAALSAPSSLEFGGSRQIQIIPLSPAMFGVKVFNVAGFYPCSELQILMAFSACFGIQVRHVSKSFTCILFSFPRQWNSFQDN